MSHAATLQCDRLQYVNDTLSPYSESRRLGSGWLYTEGEGICIHSFNLSAGTGIVGGI